MQNLRILFIISLSFVYLNGISFINFDFYSSLDKIDDNDVLIGFQFFDSNGDGIKEIFAGFDIDPYLSTNVFRLVQYSAEGELLSTNYQQNINSYVVDYQIIPLEHIQIIHFALKLIFYFLFLHLIKYQIS